MYMIPICEHSEESEKKYQEIWENLKVKLKERGYRSNIYDSAEKIHNRKGYAQEVYEGNLKSDLNDLTALEVAMLCDGGYSWYGGSCFKDGLKFNVKVYTD